jgi:hypothetical protein
MQSWQSPVAFPDSLSVTRTWINCAHGRCILSSVLHEERIMASYFLVGQRNLAWWWK